MTNPLTPEEAREWAERLMGPQRSTALAYADQAEELAKAKARLAVYEEENERLRGNAADTITVRRGSLLTVIRHIDFGAGTLDEFLPAFDEMRAAFTPDEIAYGDRAPLPRLGGK